MATPKAPRNNPPRERQQVKSYPVPRTDNLIIYEYRNGDLTKNQSPVYGETVPEHGTWPDHKLSHIAPADEVGMQKWTFVADRTNQDDYNWEVDGDKVVRTYVIPRDKYFARSIAQAAAQIPLVVDEFSYPPVTTADIKFADFGFVDDTVIRLQDPVLDSLYVVIKRRFIESVTTEIRFDERFQQNIKITKEVVAHTEPVTAPTQVAGKQIEVQHGNNFHNVKITQELVDSSGNAITYPYTHSNVPGYANYKFPPKLISANIFWLWAYAASGDVLPSYSEDYFFSWDISDPRPGPYKATIKRIITDNPDTDAIADTALTDIPYPRREAFGIGGTWSTSGPLGNATSATAKEIQVPATIHDDVAITLNGAALTGGVVVDQEVTDTLVETPGYTAFAALTECVVGYETRDLPFGLYEVSITTLDITNLYPP